MYTPDQAEEIENNIPEINGITVNSMIRNGVVKIAENNDGMMSYYGKNGSTIHPELTEWAFKQDMAWEWENPEVIGLFPI